MNLLYFYRTSCVKRDKVVMSVLLFYKLLCVSNICHVVYYHAKDVLYWGLYCKNYPFKLGFSHYQSYTIYCIFYKKNVANCKRRTVICQNFQGNPTWLQILNHRKCV